MVVHVEEGVATLFTDITQEEVKVFTKDLVECMDEATGQTSFGMYELHDLVALDPTTVGIIIKVSHRGSGRAALTRVSTGPPPRRAEGFRDDFARIVRISSYSNRGVKIRRGLMLD